MISGAESVRVEGRLFKRAERRAGLSAKLKVEFITPPTDDLEESLPIFPSKRARETEFVFVC